MIKAAFFDIDGTLVSFKTHEVPQSTIHALKALKKRGVKVFLATGRGLSLIDNVDKSFFDGILSFNGQYCHAGDGTVIYSRPIPREDIEDAVNFVESEGIACAFMGLDGMRLNRENKRTQDAYELVHFTYPPLSDLRDSIDNDIYQLIYFMPDQDDERLLKHMPSCESVRWTPIFADIIPSGGGKDVGIAKILEYYGLNREECIAFGDGENDISMLKYVGTGIAMGNASAEVKRAADFVTTSVDDKGIEKALRKLGLID